MKGLLLLVSAFAVSTVESRDTSDNPKHGLGYSGEYSSTDQDLLLPEEPFRYATAEPVLQNSDFEDQQLNDDDQFVFGETQLPDTSEIDHQIMEGGKLQIERRLRGSQCSANAICGIVGGSCISNTTRCSGWLVSEGCKSTSCKCCIPRSQEMQMTIFTLELESMKENIVNTSLHLKTDLLTMIENVNNTNAGFKKQLDTEIDTMKTEVLNHGCPEGLFWFPASDQCFKVLNTTKYNWATANQKCKAQGLELAKPYEPVLLRRYVTSRYGLDTDSWIGAQGTGSTTNWLRDGIAISTGSILWYPGHTGAKSSSYCLVFATHPSHEKGKPDNPYFVTACTTTYWAVCEFVRK